MPPAPRRRSPAALRTGTALLLLLSVLPAAGDARSGGPTPGAAGASAGSCAARGLQARRELRGMWLTTVNNIDWPSRPGLDPETVKAEYRGWLDLAQRLHHNAVFVHVRPSGDAFWPSAYAPWSQWLTGRRDGQHPGWDPLAFIVAETHARNLELHAWFNPYRGGQPAPAGPGADPARLAPGHPLRRHPDWAVVYPRRGPGARLHFDPGVPAARRFVQDAMLDAVSRYDIDGVHFDDFFYPYPVRGEDFGDDASFARYGGGFARRADWRRDNVNRLVEEMSRRIKQVKPGVKFGISPFGIWRNQRTDPAGSATRGLQSYDAIYADTRLWIRRQWLDYVVPQLYWAIGFEVADYARLLPWWSAQVAGTRVQLYIGQADYRVGQPGAWQDPAELQRQLGLNRQHGVSGSVHFSARQVRADRLGAVTRYRQAYYAEPALLPVMAQLPAAPPGAPSLSAVRRSGGAAVTVHWRPAAGRPATSFAVYRLDPGAAVARLVGTARSGGTGEHSLRDATAGAAGGHRYCVTALDRAGNESRPSAALSAR